MVGKFSTSRKSALRTWASRPSSRELNEAAAMVALTTEAVGSSAMTTVPSTWVNSPFTFDRPKCFTAKPAWVWLRSMT